MKQRKGTLRDVQKAETRRRLLDAAAEVFNREGYDGATVDQIASEAGASRPTFYLHFKDKQSVLNELIAGYVDRTKPYLEKLPGPTPTVDGVKDWLMEIGAFLEQEKALVSVMTQIFNRPHNEKTIYGLEAVDMWISALGKNSPAFAAAHSREKSDVGVRAMAELLVIEIVWAAGNVRQDRDGAFTQATLDIVAQSLQAFISDPRFQSSKVKKSRVRA